MIISAGQKFACLKCQRGHRAHSCAHLERPLFALYPGSDKELQAATTYGVDKIEFHLSNGSILIVKQIMNDPVTLLRLQSPGGCALTVQLGGKDALPPRPVPHADGSLPMDGSVVSAELVAVHAFDQRRMEPGRKKRPRMPNASFHHTPLFDVFKTAAATAAAAASGVQMLHGGSTSSSSRSKASAGMVSVPASFPTTFTPTHGHGVAAVNPSPLPASPYVPMQSAYASSISVQPTTLLTSNGAAAYGVPQPHHYATAAPQPQQALATAANPHAAFTYAAAKPPLGGMDVQLPSIGSFSRVAAAATATATTNPYTYVPNYPSNPVNIPSRFSTSLQHAFGSSAHHPASPSSPRRTSPSTASPGMATHGLLTPTGSSGAVSASTSASTSTLENIDIFNHMPFATKMAFPSISALGGGDSAATAAAYSPVTAPGAVATTLGHHPSSSSMDVAGGLDAFGRPSRTSSVSSAHHSSSRSSSVISRVPSPANVAGVGSGAMTGLETDTRKRLRMDEMAGASAGANAPPTDLLRRVDIVRASPPSMASSPSTPPVGSGPGIAQGGLVGRMGLSDMSTTTSPSVMGPHGTSPLAGAFPTSSPSSVGNNSIANLTPTASPAAGNAPHFVFGAGAGAPQEAASGVGYQPLVPPPPPPAYQYTYQSYVPQQQQQQQQVHPQYTYGMTQQSAASYFPQVTLASALASTLASAAQSLSAAAPAVGGYQFIPQQQPQQQHAYYTTQHISTHQASPSQAAPVGASATTPPPTASSAGSGAAAGSPPPPPQPQAPPASGNGNGIAISDSAYRTTVNQLMTRLKDKYPEHETDVGQRDGMLEEMAIHLAAYDMSGPKAGETTVAAEGGGGGE
ncbi:hypothetical protein HDU96_002137 [Phlyctochytrium bullatum]|nr:hypothetical protein HDU96_002137 [Phlyctochytrium bullatum]